IEMTDDAGGRILVVGQHRAAVEAGWVHAMMTGCSDGLLERFAPIIAEEHSDIPPRFGLVQTIQAVTGANTSLAPRTVVEIHLEAVLLAGARLRQWNQIAVIFFLCGDCVVAVELGKAFD